MHTEILKTELKYIASNKSCQTLPFFPSLLYYIIFKSDIGVSVIKWKNFIIIGNQCTEMNKVIRNFIIKTNI